MPTDDDNDAEEKLKRLTSGKKTGDGKRSQGNPPKGWKKAHPLPKKR